MENSKEQDISKIISEMASLTMLSGMLNDIQIKNMEIWALALFTSSGPITLSYNLDVSNAGTGVGSNNKGMVEYIINGIESPNDIKLKTLSNFMEYMFWPGIEVVVKNSDLNLSMSSTRGDISGPQ